MEKKIPCLIKFAAIMLLVATTVFAEVNGYLYQVNLDDPTISTLSVDSVDGLPAYESYRNTNTAGGIVVTPSKQYLLIGTTASGIEVLFINHTNGQLTPVAGSPFAAPINISSVAVSPDGTHVYATSLSGNTITAFGITTHGVLASLGSVATGSAPEDIVIHPNGQHVYTVNRVAPGISIYHVQPNGSLVAGGSVISGSGPTSAAIDPSGTFLYMSGTNGAPIEKFQINVDGTLTPIGAGPFGVCRSLRMHPSANILYASCSTGVHAFNVNIGNGDLTPVPGSPFGGTNTFDVAIDEDARFLYASHRVLDLIKVFHMDSDTGALVEIGNVVTRDGGGLLQILQKDVRSKSEAKFAYASNLGANVLTAHPLDILGPFGFVTGSPYAQTAVRSVEVHPFRNLLFSASNSNAGANAWNLDPSTGALSLIAGSPVLGGSVQTRMAIEPSGRFLYSTNLSQDKVGLYPIQDSGALGAITTTSTGDNPIFIATDPRGKFLYVCHAFGDTINQLEISETNGAISSVDLTDVVNPNTIVFHPSGLFAYVSNGANARIVSFSVDPEDGILTNLNADVQEFQLRALAMHPSGRFLFAGRGASIVTYNIDPNTGLLTDSGLTIGTLGQPSDLRVTRSGDLLFQVSQTGNDLTSYRINPINGALTLKQSSGFFNTPQQVAVRESQTTFPALFADHFSDNDASDWTFTKPAWTVTKGNLRGTTIKKTDIASPFGTCSQCTFETVARIESNSARISILGWFANKQTLVELMIMEDKQKIILKQKGFGVTSKVATPFPIELNREYHIRMYFDGSEIHVEVDGLEVLKKVPHLEPNGTLALRVKSTTGFSASASFRSVQVFVPQE